MTSVTLLVIWLALAGIAFSNGLDFTENEEEVPVAKRSLVQFYALTRKYTGRDPKDYLGYGCWCGYGGKGIPRDGVDRCCKQHDLCYSRLHTGRRKPCNNRWQLYFKTYYHWGLRCHTGWGSSRCGRGLCKCDVRAVKCLRRNRFNKRFKNWNKSKC